MLVSRKQETLTIRASEETKLKLEAIALKLGFKWGARPNISALVEAIAQGRVEIEDQRNQ
jgi:predicted transcriptional regulator